MREIDKLQELLTKLPGIGPRQARRFAFFLLSIDQAYVSNLVTTLNNARERKNKCEKCQRVFFGATQGKCQSCSDSARQADSLLLIARQADLENIERSGVWPAQYFLLGRNVKIAEKNPENSLPLEILTARLEDGIEELVCAFSANPEGDYTEEVVLAYLKEVLKKQKIKVSKLGRGLSTGSELEYADSATLTEALNNRH